MKKPNNKGVTLIELLIYLGLSMAMMVVLSELFISVLDESVKVQNYSAVQTDGRYIMSELRKRINSASSVTVPLNLGESADELQVVVDGTTYRYYLNSGESRMYLHEGAEDYLLSHPDSLITGLSFTRTGNEGGRPVINIEFTSSTGVAGTAQYESQTFKGTGGLR